LVQIRLKDACSRGLWNLSDFELRLTFGFCQKPTAQAVGYYRRRKALP
jgi:hypothetical protein